MIELPAVDTPLIALIAMAIGFALLIKGGDWTVESAVFIAKKFGVSPLIVGFTIVAFGTSLPELIVSVLANIDGSPGIAIGNVLGSNIANILLVIGVTAFLVPLVTTMKAVGRDTVAMMLATALFAGLMMFGEITRMAGGMMVGVLIAYIFLQYYSARKNNETPDALDDDPEYKNNLIPYGLLLMGLIAVSVGAEFLVRGAQFGAGYIGVPEAVIALSVIALGTSLPELSTCIIAAKRGHSGMALGNIIGSNVFNILMIMGVTSLVKPIAAGSFAPQLAEFDVWLTLGVAFIFGTILMVFKQVPRVVGALFILSYIAYNIYIYALYIAPPAIIGG